MKEEWQVVRKNRGSTLKQLWGRLRTGVWVPTERLMYDGQVMPPIMGGAPDTVDKQTAASGDDGSRSLADTFSATGTTAYIAYIAGYYHMFARWSGVSIEGTIDTSYIECYAQLAGSGAPELKVYGVDEDNPAAPTTYEEFDADPLTDAGVDWDGDWAADTWEQSPSLNTVFQELVDSYTISNDAVMVQIKYEGATETAYNNSRMYDFAGNAHGPKLHIEYTAAAAGVPAQMMHYMRMRRE